MYHPLQRDDFCYSLYFIFAGASSEWFSLALYSYFLQTDSTFSHFFMISLIPLYPALPFDSWHTAHIAQWKLMVGSSYFSRVLIYILSLPYSHDIPSDVWMLLSLDVLSVCLCCIVDKLFCTPGTENIRSCKFLENLF